MAENEKKKHKKGKIVLIILLVLLLIIGAVIFHFIRSYTKGIKFNEGLDEVTGEYDDSYLYAGNEKNAEDMLAMQSNDNLNGLLEDWYRNGGDLLTDKHVMNVLLIGLDTFEGTGYGNSDVMMIASVNNETKKITLCSIFRDSYTYFDTAYGPQVSKLNAAYSNGGPRYLVKAIENNYKIKIDYYAAVDFTAFVQVIDEIGGVYLDVTDVESAGIYDYTEGEVTTPVGNNVLLNGKQALYFSRMRKIYSTGDIHRTENQRKVIMAVIDKAKDLSVSQVDSVIRTLSSYVRTDCSVPNIISLGTKAILNQWFNFDIVSTDAPCEAARTPYNGSEWIWVVDYPLAAQEVQKVIYGKTNIVLDENRTTADELIGTVY